MSRLPPENYREIPFTFLVHAARAEVMIGAMARPHYSTEAKENADYLHSQKKHTLISLYKKRCYPEKVEAKGITYLHLPITDFSIASIEQHEIFYNLLTQQVRQGNHTVVHCGAGDGRSGTMLSGVVIRQQLQQEFLKAATNDTLNANRSAKVFPSDDLPVPCSKRLRNAVDKIRYSTDEWRAGMAAVERDTDIISLQQYEAAIIDKYNTYISLLHDDSTGNKALLMAIDNSDIEMLDLLALRGHDITFEHIKHAIEHHKSDSFITNLIMRSTTELHRHDTQKTTLLMLAARHGRSRIMKTLIKVGCKTDARDKWGKTAYDHAQIYLTLQAYWLITKLTTYKEERLAASLSSAKANDSRDKMLKQLINKLYACYGNSFASDTLNRILEITDCIQTMHASSSSLVRLFTPKRSHFDDLAPSIRQLIQFARDGVLALKPRRPTTAASTSATDTPLTSADDNSPSHPITAGAIADAGASAVKNSNTASFRSN